MSFTSSAVRGLRVGAFRLSSKGENWIFLRPCRHEIRSLSSVLSTNHRSISIQGTAISRSFSLWPSSKVTPTTLPPPSSPPAPLGREAAENLEGTASNNSTIESVVSTTSDTTTVPDPSFASDSEVISQSITTVTDILQRVHGPIQFGDFAALGLTSWTPAGLIRWSFEILNVVTSMPWFWTIVVGSAFWRFLCVPFTLKAARTAAIMQPHQKELAALQKKVKDVAALRNPLAMAKAQREMKSFYDKLGVSPLGGLVGFLQIPITLGLFFAVKKMCDLPVEQLKDSGLAMFPDLTAVDPTMILPIAMTVAVNVQLLVGARDVTQNLRPMLYLFHFLTIPGFFFLKIFPVGILVSILTTGLLTTAQTLILRVPAVRHALRMPPYQPPVREPGQSAFGQLRALLSKDGDVKERVAQARREAARKKNTQQTFRKL